MSKNYGRSKSEKEDPIYLLIGGTIFIIIVVLFCVIVWNVTHKEKDKIVIDNSSEVTTSASTEAEVSTDVVIPVESSSEEESTEEIGVDYNDTSNDMGLIFAEVDDKVTAKDVTNLRSEPSTSQGEATVVAKLRNGEAVVRIGKNEETGWSKLVYEDRIVYASSNYLVVVEEQE